MRCVAPWSRVFECVDSSGHKKPEAPRQTKTHRSPPPSVSPSHCRPPCRDTMEADNMALECIKDVFVRGLRLPRVLLEYRTSAADNADGIGPDNDNSGISHCTAVPDERFYAKTLLFAPGTRFRYMILERSRTGDPGKTIVYAHLAVPSGESPILLGPYAGRLSLDPAWPIHIKSAEGMTGCKEKVIRVKSILGAFVEEVARSVVHLEPAKVASAALELFARYAGPAAHSLSRLYAEAAALRIRSDIACASRDVARMQPYADIRQGIRAAPCSALLLTWVPRDSRLFSAIFGTYDECLGRNLNLEDVACFLSACPDCIPLFYACVPVLAEHMGVRLRGNTDDPFTRPTRDLIVNVIREWAIIHCDHPPALIAAEEWKVSGDYIKLRFQWMDIALLRVAMRAPDVFTQFQYLTAATECFVASMKRAERKVYVRDMLPPMQSIPPSTPKRRLIPMGAPRSSSASLTRKPSQCVIVPGLNVLNEASRARLMETLAINDGAMHCLLETEHAYADRLVLFHLPSLVQTIRLVFALRKRAATGNWKRLDYPVWYSRITRDPVTIPHAQTTALVRSVMMMSSSTDRISVYIPNRLLADEYERLPIVRWGLENNLRVSTCSTASPWSQGTLLLGTECLTSALEHGKRVPINDMAGIAEEEDDDDIAALMRKNGDLCPADAQRRARHVLIVHHAQFLTDRELHVLLSDADLEVWLILDPVSGYFAGDDVNDAAVDVSRGTLLDRLFPAVAAPHEEESAPPVVDPENYITIPTTNVTVAATKIWEGLWYPGACHVLNTSESHQIFSCKWRRWRPFGTMARANTLDESEARHAWQTTNKPLHLVLQTTFYNTCALPLPCSYTLHLVHFIHMLRDAFIARRDWDISSYKTLPKRPPFTFSLETTAGSGRSEVPATASQYTSTDALERDWLHSRLDLLFDVCDQLAVDSVRDVSEARIRRVLRERLSNDKNAI